MRIKLKVTEAQLVAMADDIGKQVQDIEKKFAEIGNEISRSKSYWEGDASDLHQKKYTDIQENLKVAIDNLKRHPENLLETAEIYRETESAAEAAAMSLPTDIII